jgi:hypothetical protein
MHSISGARLYLLDFLGGDKTQEATQDTFYNQYDPSIREEVLDSRLEGSMPCVLQFFLQILRDNLAKTLD